jgi:hypothetical protein
MPSEKELDLALASALESDPKFLDWLVSHTTFSGLGATFHSCRSNHPWGTHPFPAKDALTGEPVSSTRQSETDVLLIVRDREDRLLGVHIENKIGSGKFTQLQAEMYPYRAAHWVDNPRYGGYVAFDTVLLAPEDFRQRNAAQAALFGSFISHESVAHFIPLFGSAAGAA